MIYLPEPPEDILKKYEKLIFEKVKAKLLKANLSKELHDYFTDSKIVEILISPPETLKVLNDNVIRLIKSKKDKERLEKIFDYEGIISSSKSTSYDIAQLMNRNTCTYCNRNYTLTVINYRYKKRLNDADRISRPQFDHWFSQKDHPILALSYYNLIPSCSICNSTLKGDTKFELLKHVHPYIYENETFEFSFSYENVDKLKVKLNVETDSKMENTLKVFEIEKIYIAHADLELKDLIDLKEKYSENYIQSIIELLKGNNITKEEIIRMVFSVEHNKENFHKRPFSKFKTDILKELNIDI